VPSIFYLWLINYIGFFWILNHDALWYNLILYFKSNSTTQYNFVICVQFLFRWINEQFYYYFTVILKLSWRLNLVLNHGFMFKVSHCDCCRN
jgi:hypothetical protein